MVVNKKLKLQLYVHFGTLILNPYRHTYICRSSGLLYLYIISIPTGWLHSSRIIGIDTPADLLL